MIVALFAYHCYLIWTCQTTKEHMKMAYVYDPNPHHKHPMTSCWNTLAKNKRQSFTSALLGCSPCVFGLPKAGSPKAFKPPTLESEERPQEDARIENDMSVATAGPESHSPRLEGFMEVASPSYVVKAI